jgi:hypothetical protein
MKAVGPVFVPALALMLTAGLVAAHPLGNNTVNRQAHLQVSATRVDIDYRVDLAELRSLAAAEEADGDGDGQTTAGEWQVWRRAVSDRLRSALDLDVDGKRLALHVERSSLRQQAGEAGLAVLQLRVRLAASLPQGAGGRRVELNFADRFRDEDAGWREIYAEAQGGLKLAGGVARQDRSAGLSRFPPGEILAERSARFTVSIPAAPSVTPASAPPVPVGEVPVGEVPVGEVPTASAPVADSSVGAAATDAAEPVPRAGVADFFLLGIHHIATGWDHLVFLLGLLLLSRRTAEILRVVTAFSVAHSLTFIAAAAGWVAVPGRLVEALIALTIAYVGALALLRRPSGHGLALALLFGLVHGFGFAGALAESLGAVDTAWPGWLYRLAAFNLGIEAFQVALVFVALALFHWLRRLSWRAHAHAAASASVLVSGLVWFFSRLSS